MVIHMKQMFSNKRTLKLVFIKTLVVLVTLACSLNLSECGLDGGEATAPFPSLSSPTPIPTLQSTFDPGILPPLPTATHTQDSAPQPPPSGPGSTASGAACLPGTWHVDHSSVINYMTLTMFGVGEFDFTPISSSGKLELQIIPGQIVLLAEYFKVDVGVNIGGVANVNVNNIYIQANGHGNYSASDSKVDLTNISYNSMGTMESTTGSFSMDMNDLLTIANAFGFARGKEVPIQSTSVNYTCSGDILTIVVNKYASVTFVRIN
jgi:hypothetical protein